MNFKEKEVAGRPDGLHRSMETVRRLDYLMPGRRGRAELRNRKAGNSVVAKVSDTGPGIPPAVRARLFEPFVTTKPPGKGLGLGLSISAAIAHNHRETISLKSRAGRGAQFRIALPIPPSRRSPDHLLTYRSGRPAGAPASPRSAATREFFGPAFPHRTRYVLATLPRLRLE